MTGDYTQMQSLIDAETDTDMKELYAMLFFGMLYVDYVKSVAPETHARALQFTADTHGLRGVQFNL